MRIPKLCRHRASGQAYVTDPRLRKEHYFGPWGTPETEEAYEVWRREFLAWNRAHAAAQKPVPPGGLNVSELAGRFLDHAEQWYVKGGKPTSEVILFKMVAGVLWDLYPTLKAAELRPGHLKTVRQVFVDRGQARSTINSLVGKVRQIWRWGVEQELVPVETLQALREVRNLPRGKGGRETAPVPPVAWELVEATLPRLSAVVQGLVCVQYLGAMRPGEVVLMRPCDVERAGAPWLYQPHAWKTEHHEHSRRREIWLGPQARARLTPLLDGAPAEGWVFPGRKSHFDEGSYRDAIRQACLGRGGRSPLPHWHPNQLRHAMATEIRRKFRREGVHPLEAAQSVLGHSSASMTEVYAERDRDLAREIVEQLG